MKTYLVYNIGGDYLYYSGDFKGESWLDLLKPLYKIVVKSKKKLLFMETFYV